MLSSKREEREWQRVKEEEWLRKKPGREREEEEETLHRRLNGLVLSSLLDHSISWAMFDQQFCVWVWERGRCLLWYWHCLILILLHVNKHQLPAWGLRSVFVYVYVCGDVCNTHGFWLDVLSSLQNNSLCSSCMRTHRLTYKQYTTKI